MFANKQSSPEDHHTSSPQQTIKFAKGEFLFKQGERTRDLYIIKDGKVRIFKNEGNVEIDLDTVGPGQVVGEIASIDGGPRSASGEAIEDSEVILIDATKFQSIVDGIPDWFRKISLILVQRLREVDDKINLSIEGNRSRHAAAMLSLIAYSDKCTPCDEGFEVPLTVVENEFLDLLNLPATELNSILEKFEKQGFLKVDHGRLVLAFRNSLDNLSERFFQSTEPTIPVT